MLRINVLTLPGVPPPPLTSVSRFILKVRIVGIIFDKVMLYKPVECKQISNIPSWARQGHLLPGTASFQELFLKFILKLNLDDIK